jgi:aspartate racemase
MASHIAIVACSAEGAALCYRTICIEGPAFMGDHNHPEVSMHTFPFKLHVDAIGAMTGRRLPSLCFLLQ